MRDLRGADAYRDDSREAFALGVTRQALQLSGVGLRELEIPTAAI
jgi:hypothetical protein